MRLFESQTYDFDWWIVIRGKRTCPLTRGVYFLECPFIRYFTAFVSFPFSGAWAGDQYSFSRTTFLLVFVVPKTVYYFWYGGLWVEWNWRNLPLFCISEGKIVRWQEDHIHNFIISTKYPIRVSISQTIRKWDHKSLGTCHPQFIEILQRYPRYLPELLSLSVSKFMFFLFSFEIKNCLSVDNLMVWTPGFLPSW